MMRIFTCFVLFAFSLGLHAQTTFWSDNFDAPSGGANNNNAGAGWTLNGEGNTSNRWFINTPPGWGCSTSGNALHISCSGGLCGFLGGPNTPLYNAASSLVRTAVSPDISTVGQTNITLQFVYKCAGFANNDYGKVAISDDGGSTWNELADNYVGTPNCATKTIAIPAQYEGVSNFKIRFKWLENNSSNGVDPPFTIDNIILTTPSASCTPPTVSAGTNVAICLGNSTTIGGSPTATGGSEAGAFVYSWTPTTGLNDASIANPTANPIITTVYTVSVHRGTPSCAATSQVTVTVNTPQVLAITPVGSTTICQGGSVTLNATAGFTNYSWTTPSGVQTGASITASAAGAYSVTATGSNNCPSASTITTITVNTPQALAITPVGSTTICQGGSVTLNATAGFTNYSWTTPSGVQTGASITASAAGAYSVTATGSNNCPSASTTTTITVNNPQTLSITPVGSTTICQGGSVTLNATAGFTGYTWTTPSGTQTGASITASAAGAYSVTATGSNNCPSASTSTTITVNTPQALAITPVGSTTICQGSSVTLNATAGFTGYTWTTPSGTQTGASITASAAGAYSVTATGSNNCPSTSSVVNVIVNNPIALTTTPSGAASICSGTPATLTAAAGFTSYVWTTPSGNQSGASISASVAGSYSVSAVGSNNCPSTSAAIVVSVNTPQALTITPAGSTTICQGSSVTLNATAGFTGYTWTTPSGTQTGASVNATAAGAYSVTATGSNNCPSSSTVTTVTVNAAQILSITAAGSTTICQGSSVTLNATAGFTGYTWTTPSGTQTGASVNAIAAGSYSVTATGSNSCPSTSTVTTIIINTPQPLSITPIGSTTICESGSVTLNATAGFTGYTWTTPSGTQTGASVNASAAGAYSVTATGSNNCLSSSTVTTITVSTPQALTITPVGSTSICQGNSVTLNATAGFTGYTWTTPTGTQTGASINASAAGAYSVTATGSNNCPSTSIVTTIIVNTPQALNITPAGSTAICQGTSVTLDATFGFTSYTWTTPSGAQTGASINASVAGNYSVSAIGSNGCSSSSSTISLTTSTAPEITVTPAGPISICPGTPVTLTAQDGFTNYTWSNNQNGSTLTTSTSGSFSVSAIASNGCQSTSQSVNITVFEEPETIIVNPSGPITICQGQSATITATGSYSSYLWSTNDTTASIQASSAGTYIVTAINSDGCSASSNSINVSFSTPFSISINPANDLTLCDGESVTLQAQSGFSNYSWSNQQTGPSLTVTAAGGYSVSATNSAGCTGTSGIVNVSTHASPNASFTYNQISNYVVNFTNTSTGLGTSLWNFGSNNTSVELNPSFNFPFDGSWPVSLIVSNNCGFDTLNTNVSVIKTGISTLNNSSVQVAVTEGNINITSSLLSPETCSIILFDLAGKEILNQSVLISAQSTTSIPKPTIASGIYLLQINSKNVQYNKPIYW
jgi:large repetitive protein